jgi:hypothetical protein
MKHEDLDHTIKELIREYGINAVIYSIVEACDSSADFAHSCNDRTIENYWRKAAVAILDVIPRMPEKLPNTRA